jgi:hypothetical protein
MIFESHDHAEEMAHRVFDRVWPKLHRGGCYVGRLGWEWDYSRDEPGMDFIVNYKGHYITTFMSADDAFSSEWAGSTATKIAAWLLIQGGLYGANARSKSEEDD